MEQHGLSIMYFDYIIQLFLNNSTFDLEKLRKFEILLGEIKFRAPKTFTLGQNTTWTGLYFQLYE